SPESAAMPLAEDIRALADRSLAALDASHDYYLHTKAAWRLVRRLVAEGRKFTIRIKTTGTATDQQAFAALAYPYITGYLISSTFQDFVAVFEDFFFGLFRLWLAAYPASLSEKEVKFSTVLKAPDMAAITLAVVDKELNELKYERVTDWF